MPALRQCQKGCLVKRADSLLAPLIRNLGIEDSVRLGRIRNEWAVIFEKPVSLHMAPAGIKEKELLINVDSPVWLQQLNFYKDTIIKKLSGFGIKTVRFKIGRVLPEKKQYKTILEKRLLTANENSYIEETISPVPDHELRDKIKKAMEKSMSFKR